MTAHPEHKAPGTAGDTQFATAPPCAPCRRAVVPQGSPVLQQSTWPARPSSISAWIHRDGNFPLAQSKGARRVRSLEDGRAVPQACGGSAPAFSSARTAPGRPTPPRSAFPGARRCQRGPKRRPELPEAPRGAANPRRSAGGAGPPRGSAAERCPGGAEPRSAPWRRPTGLCPTARRGERAAARPRRRGKRR